MNRQLFALFILLCTASAALATTYVRVEKDGTKTYSDRPIPGGQPLDLQPAQTFSAPAVSPSQGNLPREQQLLQEMDNFLYESCSLTPANDTTFINPESVTVSVQSNPGLRAGDLVELKVDGAPKAGQGVASVTIAPVVRGTHTVSLTVKDRFGKLLCSATTVFHVHRPSIYSPTRR